MNLKVLKRRAEMLNAVSAGLHPSAVVSQLAGKYGFLKRLCGVIGTGVTSGFLFLWVWRSMGGFLR